MVLVGVFLISVLGWNSFVWYKQSLLAEMAAPFYEACQTASGCILAPDGWQSDGTGGYYNSLYEYSATKSSFTLRQHLATDVWLAAEGGNGTPIRTTRVVN